MPRASGERRAGRAIMWKTLNINKNNIITETDRAVLIACPHASDYDGYSFWHPSKLVRNGRHRAAVSISYTEEFTFRLKKYGKGKYNSREVLDEVQLGYDEIEDVFGVIDDCIYPPDEPLIYTPDPIEPEHAEVDPSLRDE